MPCCVSDTEQCGKDDFASLCALNTASVAPLASLAGRIVNFAVDSSTESGGRVGSNVVRPSLRNGCRKLAASGMRQANLGIYVVSLPTFSYDQYELHHYTKHPNADCFPFE